MKTTSISIDEFRGVFAVPPLARRDDAHRSIDFDENNLIVRHIINGGITRLIYGGNAFLYHVTLSEYELLLEWLSGFKDHLWVIPSIGPSYGRAMDQAAMLRNYKFPCAMMLPSSDPRDATGLEQGYREVAEAANTKLLAYLKSESSFGPDTDAGLDALAQLIEDGTCVGIKYAVVREDPASDAYLNELLKRVDRSIVLSGIGERPAITHLRDWSLPGFTTGSGCVAPHLSRLLFGSCAREDYEAAERLRSGFIPLEDLRDEWGPAKVLHYATEAAGVAKTGPVPPYLSALSADQQETLSPVARELIRRNSVAATE